MEPSEYDYDMQRRYDLDPRNDIDFYDLIEKKKNQVYDEPWFNYLMYEERKKNGNEPVKRAFEALGKRAFEALGKRGLKKNKHFEFIRKSNFPIEKRAFEALGKRSFEAKARRAFEALGRK